MTMETGIAGMLRGREVIRPERFTFRSSRLDGGMHRPAHAGSARAQADRPRRRCVAFRGEQRYKGRS